MSTLYKVTFGHQMGLVRAVDEDDAYARMERRIGTDNGPINIEKASEDDEAWFKNMGGGHIDTTGAARQEDRGPTVGEVFDGVDEHVRELMGDHPGLFDGQD